MKKIVAILAVVIVAVCAIFGVQNANISKELSAVTANLDTAHNAAKTAEAKVAELENAAKTAADTAAAELKAAQDAAAAELAAAKEAAAAELKAAQDDAQAKVDELIAVNEKAAADLAAAQQKITDLESIPAPAVEEAPAEEAPVEEAPAEEAPAVEVPAEDADLKAAASYLRMMYKNSPETTPADYEVVSKIIRGEKEYVIEWTADSETVKIIPGDFVTIDVDEKNPEEIHYVLTATLKNEAGEVRTLSFNHKVPAAMILEGLSYEEIVAAAYTLEDGLAMEEPQRLFGTVVKIPTPWSDEYKNITVDIQIGELADQPIQCYRLSGEGAENLKVGDQITVEGIIKNYKGLIEFDKGCQLIGYGEIISQKAILDAAYALEDGMAMPAPTALEGVIVKIVSAYSEEYKNITVDFVCDGKEDQVIEAYRLSGEGAEALAEGDKIAVYGTIKNYKGLIEFDKGCQLIPFGTAADVRTVLSAYTLEDGLAMEKPQTLTGVISSIDTEYSPDYKNITVTIVVAGLEDNKIQCYRLSGEGAETLAVGDTITVTGTIKNYKGTIEFDKGCTFVK